MLAISQKLDYCSVLEAELWAIYHGICIAWGRGFSNLIIESDSSEAISLLDSQSFAQYSLADVISGIRSIGADRLQVQWKHILREANQVADLLAKDSIDSSSTCCIYDYVPLSWFRPFWQTSKG